MKVGSGSAGLMYVSSSSGVVVFALNGESVAAVSFSMRSSSFKIVWYSGSSSVRVIPRCISNADDVLYRKARWSVGSVLRTMRPRTMRLRKINDEFKFLGERFIF